MQSENQPGNKLYFSLLHTFSVLELLRKKLWDMMSLNVLHIPKRTSRCLFVHFFFLSNLFLKKSKAMIILQEGPLFQSQGPCKSNGGITATSNRLRVDSCCHWENGKEVRHYNIDFNDPLGKVPNLVCEVETYQQNAVGLNIIHSFGSGTNSLIDGGLGPTQELSIVRFARSMWVLLTNHWLGAAQLDFLQVDVRVTIMWLHNAERKTITAVCAYVLIFWMVSNKDFHEPKIQANSGERVCQSAAGAKWYIYFIIFWMLKIHLCILQILKTASRVL